jgi:uncharacterized protein YodC (DUF2158 family)
MRFKPGDLVIRKDGGNKMRVISCNSGKYDCYWFTDRNYQSSFEESDLILFSQYHRILNRERRKDTIKKILAESF